MSALAGVRAHEIAVSGRRVVVYEGGVGPVVLLLHGLPDRAAAWSSQIGALLDAGYRVIAPDLPGLGDSEPPAELSGWTVAADTDTVLAVMDAFEVEVARVVGHDRGCGPGWSLAALWPQRVDRFAALSVGHLAALADVSLEQRRRAWYTLYFQFAVEDQLRADDWHLLRVWLGDHPNKQRVIADLSRDGALTACLNYYRANFHPEAIPAAKLPAVSVPTLGVFGAQDPYLNIEQMARSAEHVTGPWRMVRLDGAGHWLPEAASADLNPVLLQFLQEDFARTVAV
ncbi:alpha/beta hydrolase [Mycobacterium sp.]|uniref:alpha/beta fold hydrolase n=1 Tax=Mycobacterium sp. TaxID=1785 RepID=UPI00257967CE|nr:alpha/beta hydrolase [Mycobacterium sp.]